MLTKAQVLKAIRAGRESACLDHRDYMRLTRWFHPRDWRPFGFEFTGEDPDAIPVEPWTREAIVEQMKKDVAFGFEKAVNQRGLSADLMFHVIKMWLWILEDPLQYEPYDAYGVGLLTRVADKYGFPVP